MTIQELGSIGEFVAAIATIATLTYLAVQIRQNTAQARATATQDVLNSHREMIRELFAFNPELLQLFTKGINSFPSLAPNEKQLFHIVMSDFLLHGQNASQLHRKGVLDEHDAGVWVNFLVSIVRMPGLLDWWHAAREVLDPEWRAEIESQLDQPGLSLGDVLPFFTDAGDVQHGDRAAPGS